MKNIKEEILLKTDNLVAQYEDELDFLKNRNMKSFDMSQLPDIIRDMVSLSIAKAPTFSNVAAVTIANFVLSHTFGQVRPKISDTVYSADILGINTYGFLLSNSGSG